MGRTQVNTAYAWSEEVQNKTGVGIGALTANTTGVSNTATGASALRSNTTGNNNTASGSRALYGNSTGTHNTASVRTAVMIRAIKNSAKKSGYSVKSSPMPNNTKIAETIAPALL